MESHAETEGPPKVEQKRVLQKELFINVRTDLQEYYDVLNHQDGTLVCKLASTTPNCMMGDGKGCLKYSTKRGWFNFERHLIRVHKFPKTLFLKGSHEPSIFTPPKPIFPIEPVSSGKCCVVCRNTCMEPGFSWLEGGGTFGDILWSFPGSSGCYKLNQQLIAMFFLRKIIGFPRRRCQEFIRRCRGLRTPETWFSFCGSCKSIILKAAELQDRIASLQRELEEVKVSVNGILYGSTENNTDVSLSAIENEVRHYVLESSSSEQLSKLNLRRKDGPLDGVIVSDAGEDVSTKLTGKPTLLKKDVRKFSSQKELDKMESTRAEAKMLEGNIAKLHPGRRRSGRIPNEISVNAPVIKEEPPDVGDLPSDSDLAEPPSPDEYCLPDLCDCDEDSDYDYNPKSNKRLKSPVSSLPLTDGRLKRKRKISTKKSQISAKTDQKRNLFVCSICPAKYNSSQSLKEHEDVHEISKALDNIHDCQHCGFPCTNARAKAGHISQKHKETGGFECSLCSYTAPRQRLLFEHMKEHRENSRSERVGGKYLCNLCNRLFKSYLLVCKHKRSAHHKEIGIVPFRCEHCSRIFSNSRRLRDHVLQTHKKESKFYCEICGKGTLYMSKLRRHMKTHIKDKTFICEVCGADFLYNESLKGHILKEHPDIFKAVDDTFIPVSDSKLASVQSYTCKHCGQVFASSSCLFRHVKTHEEVFKYKCDQCGRGYATQQSLRRHININHSTDQVPCPYCDKMFLHKEYVRAHYKFCQSHPGRVEFSGEPLEPSDVTHNNDVEDCEGNSSTEIATTSENLSWSFDNSYTADVSFSNSVKEPGEKLIETISDVPESKL